MYLRRSSSLEFTTSESNRKILVPVDPLMTLVGVILAFSTLSIRGGNDFLGYWTFVGSGALAQLHLPCFLHRFVDRPIKWL